MGAFLEQIDRVAMALENARAGYGSRVGLLSENGPGYAAVIGACLRIGAVVVPISTRYPAQRVNQVVARTGCSLVLASRSLSGVAPRGPLTQMEEIMGSFEGDVRSATLDQMGADLGNQASIIMTSGSQGAPHGVLHRVSQHYYSAAGADMNMPFGGGHRWLMLLPMYHVSGFSILMRAFLHGGGVVFPRAGQPLEEAVLWNDATHLSLVPVQLTRLMDRPDCVKRLRTMEAILLGGSAAPVALVQRAVEAGLPIHTTYGSTEAASQAATTRKGDLTDQPGTSGRVLEHRKLRIAENGEILIGGRTMLDGYIEDGLVRPAVDTDGWFHSGDAGVIDEAGLLYVRGRKDSMFISGGENIHPEEIERVLETAPGVEQAVVVGVEAGEIGRRPVAFVKTRAGEEFDGDLLRHWVAERVERFKIPAAFFNWSEAVESHAKPDRQALTVWAHTLMAKTQDRM